jgi:prolyl-tRNA synthetase
VIKGEKSPSERFAGAEKTYTIEAMMQNGWALQSGTSHFLGKNFAKAFDVMYQSKGGSRTHVSATSWGVSTRLLGALIMTHSDDKGLVLPPKVSPVQVVIVPVRTGKVEVDEMVTKECILLRNLLKKSGVRCQFDDREEMRHGAKFFEWEQKGVPVRIEVGPRDLERRTVVVATRHSLTKQEMKLDDIVGCFSTLLQDIQVHMYQNALLRMKSRIAENNSYQVMKAKLLDKQSSGFFIVPWRCNAANEVVIKDDCKATIRCYPFENNQQPPSQGTKCFYSGEQATHYALFARAF